jgi:hypothetical protein
VDDVDVLKPHFAIQPTTFNAEAVEVLTLGVYLKLAAKWFS